MIIRFQAERDVDAVQLRRGCNALRCLFDHVKSCFEVAFVVVDLSQSQERL